MIPDRIGRPDGTEPSRASEGRSDPGLFSGSAGGIGGHRATGDQFRAPPLGGRLGPPLRNEHVGIAWRQLEAIADRRMFEVDAVDHFRILAYQADAPPFIGPAFKITATLRLSTLVRRTAGSPYPVPVHCRSNPLTAKNMPIVDGTKYRSSSMSNRAFCRSWYRVTHRGGPRRMFRCVRN
jgi:hypothetical protein